MSRSEEEHMVRLVSSKSRRISIVAICGSHVKLDCFCGPVLLAGLSSSKKMRRRASLGVGSLAPA